MAQGGPGRSGGKARPAGRGSTTGRNSSPGRGTGARQNKQQTAAAAQRAIRGARGKRGSGQLLKVGLPIAVVVIVAAAVIVGVLITNKNKQAAIGDVPPTGDSSSAILASTGSQATGQTVDGVQSNDTEQVLFHIHAHLAIYVNGTLKRLPYGVGIVGPYQLQNTADGPFVAGGSKFYWLHTHDETGVIHIESPQQRTFTLANFFHIWNQPLSASQVGPAKGTVTAFVDGKKYAGDPGSIPLKAHAVIQLDVGTVVPPASYTFAQNL